REVPFVKNFFEIFLKFFQEPKLPKSLQRLLLCGFFSGCRGRSRVGEPEYNTTPNQLCQHLFFRFSDKFFASFLFNRYIVVLGGFAVCCGAEDAGGLFFHYI
ncbi:hypothetical protein, partial [uncultured Subdoligranulum sp.]|uniref:hypothetical protein n=1 Tax=uncultured Subdoligranulum sp. TaxID=512298 RepID=UPI0025CC13B2